MNERIQDLIKQATIRVNNPLVDSDGKVVCDDWEEGVSLSKFAELIVRECANRVDWILAEGGKTQGDLIKEHFGVEEPKGWVCPECGVDRTKDVCPKGHTASLTGDCPMVAEAQ